MTRTRIRLIHGVTQQYGLSLGEFFALEVASVFATDPKTAVGFIKKALQDSPDAGVNCRAALASCVAKGWLMMSPRKVLMLTQAGTAMMHKIAGDLRHPA
jgi:hypothetical protein